jgi:hypothetical protein
MSIVRPIWRLGIVQHLGITRIFFFVILWPIRTKKREKFRCHHLLINIDLLTRQTQHLNTVSSFIYSFAPCFGQQQAKTQVQNGKSVLWKRSLLQNLRDRLHNLVIIHNKKQRVK